MSNQNDDQMPSNDDSAKRPFNPNGGEDESSAPNGAIDDHLHDDQKPLHQQNLDGDDQIDDDDPNKVEELAKAGRDNDPDAGSD